MSAGVDRPDPFTSPASERIVAVGLFVKSMGVMDPPTSVPTAQES